MDLTRRRFLETSLALAASGALSGLPAVAEGAKSPVAVPGSLTRTSTLLRGIINKYARLEDDPWTLMHGVRAMGHGFTIKGEHAADFLCSRFLKKKAVAGKTYLYMPSEYEGGHTNAFLKTILETGLPPSQGFQLDGGRYTVGDLVNSAKALFTFDPKTAVRDDLAWSLIAFSLQIPPGADQWTNAYGQQIRFSEVVRFGFDVLDDATRQFKAAKERGVLPEANDKIVDFTCGGTHLVYGLASCVGNGYRDEHFSGRLKEHLDLMVWRLEADGHLIEKFYREVPPPPGNPPGWQQVYSVYHNDAKIKFYGHTFEILSYVRLRRLFTPSPAQSRSIERAAATLAGAVRGIEGIDLFDVRKTNPRLFHLLIGDSCHAYHGIHMVPGVNQVESEGGGAA